MDIAVDSRGHIYVVDAGNTRVQHFNADWQVVDTWTSVPTTK